MQTGDQYQYQVVQRRLNGFLFYEVYRGQNIAGGIKKANVPGAPVRIRGRNGLDLVIRQETGEGRKNEMEYKFEHYNDHTLYGVVRPEGDKEYCLKTPDGEEIIIHMDASGFACTRAGKMVVHIEKQQDKSLSLKDGGQVKDKIPELQRMYVSDPENEELVLALTGAVFLLYWNLPESFHEKNRCYHCMKAFDYGYEICPHCGFDISERPVVGRSLFPGQYLKERYLAGEMFEQGGDFLAYHGWDRIRECRVTIREFFPVDMVKRVQGEKDIIVYPEEAYPKFTKLLDRYMEQYHIVSDWQNPVEIFALTDGFEQNGTGYLIFDSAGGQTFSEYLEKEGDGLTPDLAADLVEKLCEAVRQIHQAGRVLGEISMEQLVRMEDGSVKLDPACPYQNLRDRETGNVAEPWTYVRYASPELVKGGSMIGPWMDVYSIGAVFYHLLTGIAPPSAEERQAGRELKIGKDQPYAQIVEKAMDMGYAKRYYDADALLKAIRQLDDKG